MYYTATATSPYQRTTTCQRLGFQNPVTAPRPLGTDTLDFGDLLHSLTRVAYEEELARREKIAAELKRKRYEQAKREQQLRDRQKLIRLFEDDEFFQIQILKQRPSKSHFKSYQIQYFKKADELLLRISSDLDHFTKDYKFDSTEVDEKAIDYKVVDDRLLVINVPKRKSEDIRQENIFNLLQQQKSRLQEARFEQYQQYREQKLREQKLREQQRQAEHQQALREQAAKAQFLRQKAFKEQQLREQQLKEQQLREARAKQMAEAQRRREQIKLQEERQEALQAFFNSYVQHNTNSAKPSGFLNINGFQVPFSTHQEQEQDQDDSDVAEEDVSETDSENESFEDTPPTPEFSDIEPEEQDPEVSDISQVLESNVIKPVSSNAVESDSEIDDEESSTKKRKVRSPSIEDVEDEEFTRWKN